MPRNGAAALVRIARQNMDVFTAPAVICWRLLLYSWLIISWWRLATALTIGHWVLIVTVLCLGLAVPVVQCSVAQTRLFPNGIIDA